MANASSELDTAAARKLLTGQEPGRPGDDSEDELHTDVDPEWEWIYAPQDHEASQAPAKSADDTSDQRHPHPQQRNDHRDEAPPSRPTRSAADLAQKNTPGKICAARLGRFTVHIGDTVALKADRNDVWVAVVTDFIDRDTTTHDDDDDDVDSLSSSAQAKSARFMWLTSPKEIYNRQKRRDDALPNELYATASLDENPLETITGRAAVVSLPSFYARYPTGKVPRKSPDFNRMFVCRRGVNLRTATYTPEFQWEEVYRGAGDIEALKTKIETETQATRKRKAEDARAREIDGEYHDRSDEDYDEATPKTPTKRRKVDAPTPKSKRQNRTPTSKYTTPTHKRIIQKKPLEFTPLGTRVLSPAHTPNSTPHTLARTRLHVASVPAALPCREEEFSTVYAHLESAITDGVGSCIYISGTPGTGKTATVREVVAQLHASVQAEELDDFAFVEINGMKVTDPHQSYSLLWEAVTGERVAPQHALGLLSREFSQPSPRRVPVVVLMDELDQLVTKSQSVMYNFFHWPSLPHARLIVLAVANTMDLPERTLSNKISSRLGLRRVTFQGYSHNQLMKIIESRLEDVPGDVVDPDAIQFASRKVAQVSGDARRALDMCRRAVEMAELEAAPAEGEMEIEDVDSAAPDTPSKRGRGNSASATKKHGMRGRVTIQTIQRAIREATTSPLQQYLRALPLAPKVFLAALLARNRRTGVAETCLGDVVDEAKKLAGMSGVAGLREWLMVDALYDASADVDKIENQYSWGKQVEPRMLGMGAAASELLEAGVIIVEERRGERGSRTRLQVAEEEVKGALRDDWEVKGLGFDA